MNTNKNFNISNKPSKKKLEKGGSFLSRAYNLGLSLMNTLIKKEVRKEISSPQNIASQSLEVKNEFDHHNLSKKRLKFDPEIENEGAESQAEVKDLAKRENEISGAKNRSTIGPVNLMSFKHSAQSKAAGNISNYKFSSLNKNITTPSTENKNDSNFSFKTPTFPMQKNISTNTDNNLNTLFPEDGLSRLINYARETGSSYKICSSKLVKGYSDENDEIIASIKYRIQNKNRYRNDQIRAAKHIIDKKNKEILISFDGEGLSREEKEAKLIFEFEPQIVLYTTQKEGIVKRKRNSSAKRKCSQNNNNKDNINSFSQKSSSKHNESSNNIVINNTSNSINKNNNLASNFNRNIYTNPYFTRGKRNFNEIKKNAEEHKNTPCNCACLECEKVKAQLEQFKKDQYHLFHQNPNEKLKKIKSTNIPNLMMHVSSIGFTIESESHPKASQKEEDKDHSGYADESARNTGATQLMQNALSIVTQPQKDDLPHSPTPQFNTIKHTITSCKKQNENKTNTTNIDSPSKNEIDVTNTHSTKPVEIIISPTSIDNKESSSVNNQSQSPNNNSNNNFIYTQINHSIDVSFASGGNTVNNIINEAQSILEVDESCLSNESGSNTRTMAEITEKSEEKKQSKASIKSSHSGHIHIDEQLKNYDLLKSKNSKNRDFGGFTNSSESAKVNNSGKNSASSFATLNNNKISSKSSLFFNKNHEEVENKNEILSFFENNNNIKNCKSESNHESNPEFGPQTNPESNPEFDPQTNSEIIPPANQKINSEVNTGLNTDNSTNNCTTEQNIPYTQIMNSTPENENNGENDSSNSNNLDNKNNETMCEDLSKNVENEKKEDSTIQKNSFLVNNNNPFLLAQNKNPGNNFVPNKGSFNSNFSSNNGNNSTGNGNTLPKSLNNMNNPFLLTGGINNNLNNSNSNNSQSNLINNIGSTNFNQNTASFNSTPIITGSNNLAADKNNPFINKNFSNSSNNSSVFSSNKFNTNEPNNSQTNNPFNTNTANNSNSFVNNNNGLSSNILYKAPTQNSPSSNSSNFTFNPNRSSNNTQNISAFGAVNTTSNNNNFMPAKTFPGTFNNHTNMSNNPFVQNQNVNNINSSAEGRMSVEKDSLNQGTHNNSNNYMNNVNSNFSSQPYNHNFSLANNNTLQNSKFNTPFSQNNSNHNFNNQGSQSNVANLHVNPFNKNGFGSSNTVTNNSNFSSSSNNNLSGANPFFGNTSTNNNNTRNTYSDNSSNSNNTSSLGLFTEHAPTRATRRY